jgi:hypothetical protein
MSTDVTVPRFLECLKSLSAHWFSS